MKSRIFLSFLLLVASVSVFAQTATSDIAVFKEGPPEAAADTDVTYTVTVTNVGPDDASSVTLSDPVPAGMTFVSATQESGPVFSCDSAVTCTIATFPAGATSVFTFVFHIDSATPPGTTFLNVATVSTTSFDPNPENDSSAAGTSTPAAPQGDVGVSKSGPSGASPDSDVVYTITVTNGGTGPATNVTVEDTLPGDLTFVSLTNDGPFSCSTPAVGAGGTITCSAASFAAGATATITLTAHVPPSATSGTSYTNVVTAKSDADPNPENDTSLTVLVISTADLSVLKSGPATANAGDTVDYTIVLANPGPDLAVDVLLVDTVPANTTFVSLVQNTGSAFSCTENACSIPAFAPGSSATFTLTLLIGNTTSVTNVASVTASSADPDTTNNTSSATTVVTPLADLTVTKSGPATVVATNTATFTVTITNDGPSDATNVTLSDLVPAGMTFVSANQTSGPAFTCDSTVTCTRATFALGASATFDFTFQVNVDTIGPVTNTATVASDTTDPNPSDNSSSTITDITPAPADLRIAKTASVSQALPNGSATYTIVVTNDGPGTATNVVVTDVLPAGVTLVSASAGCTGTSTVTCNVGTLAAGNSATITLDVLLPQSEGSVVNTATVDAAEDDPDNTNDAASAAIAVGAAAAIPSLSAWGLMLLAIALAAVAMLRT